MSTSRSSQDSSVSDSADVAGPPLALLTVAAWVIPGLGHAFLKRWRRGVVFFCLVLFSASLGALLEGKLFTVVGDQPLSRLGTLASMGMGAPYFVLRYALSYEGNILSATYEYGGAFLLTAGLMNLLVVLDVWDIRQGRKE